MDCCKKSRQQNSRRPEQAAKQAWQREKGQGKPGGSGEVRQWKEPEAQAKQMAAVRLPAAEAGPLPKAERLSMTAGSEEGDGVNERCFFLFCFG